MLNAQAVTAYQPVLDYIRTGSLDAFIRSMCKLLAVRCKAQMPIPQARILSAAAQVIETHSLARNGHPIAQISLAMGQGCTEQCIDR